MLGPLNESIDTSSQIDHSASQPQLERPKPPFQHVAASDDMELMSHSQAVPRPRATILRPLSQISIATTEESAKRCSDDEEVMRRISRLLRHPLTPTSQEFVGPDSKPLGVEVAINAYRRGELSSEDVDYDLVPPALRSLEEPPLEDVSPYCFENDAWNSLRDRQMGSVPLAAGLETPPADDTLMDHHTPMQTVKRHVETCPWQSPKQSSFFETMIQSLDEALPENGLRERISVDIAGNGPPAIDIANQSPHNHHDRPADAIMKVAFHSRRSQQLPFVSIDSTEGFPLAELTSQNPAPLHGPPIAPEWVEVLRSQLPQAHHLRDTISCSPDQASIHPALRYPATSSGQDIIEDDSCGSSTIRASVVSIARTEPERQSNNSTADTAPLLPSFLTESSPQRQTSDSTITSQIESAGTPSYNISTGVTDTEVVSKSNYSPAPIGTQNAKNCSGGKEGNKHVSWPTEGSPSMTQPGIRPKSVPEEVPNLSGTISDTRKRHHNRKSSKVNLARDETYSRAQSMLFAQRPPAPNKPRPSPDPSLQKPSERASKLVSNSKLAEFFGEDFTKVAEKSSIVLEREHDQMVRQLSGGKSKRLSGVGEDVKKGLRRLLG